jgi:hypothetical protein
MRAVDRGHYSTDPDQAYCDRPHGIGCCTLVSCVVCHVCHSLAFVSPAQTISAPHMHAMCLELLLDHAVPGYSKPLSPGSLLQPQTHSPFAPQNPVAGPRCSTSDRGAATSRRASATWSATRAKSSASTGTNTHNTQHTTHTHTQRTPHNTHTPQSCSVRVVSCCV